MSLAGHGGIGQFLYEHGFAAAKPREFSRDPFHGAVHQPKSAVLFVDRFGLGHETVLAQDDRDGLNAVFECGSAHPGTGGFDVCPLSLFEDLSDRRKSLAVTKRFEEIDGEFAVGPPEAFVPVRREEEMFGGTPFAMSSALGEDQPLLFEDTQLPEDGHGRQSQFSRQLPNSDVTAAALKSVQKALPSGWGAVHIVSVSGESLARGGAMLSSSRLLILSLTAFGGFAVDFLYDSIYKLRKSFLVCEPTSGGPCSQGSWSTNPVLYRHRRETRLNRWRLG